MQQIFSVLCGALLLAQIVLIWRYCRKRKRETRLLREQERFLGEVAVSYTRTADLREAVRESIRTEDTCMAAEGNELLDSLEKETSDEEAEYYLSKAKNSFFSVFYALCHTVKNLGDIKKDGLSLFVKNIQYIEEEVRMEILRIQNAQYQFSGLLALCAAPFFLIPFIRAWAVSSEPAMEHFYDGGYGMGTTLVCFAASSAGLALILWLHYPDLKPLKKYRVERRLLAVSWIGYLVDKKISRRYSRCLQKNEELKKLQGFGNIRQFILRRYICAALGFFFVFTGVHLVKHAARAQLQQEFAVPSVWTVELTETEKQELSGTLRAAFGRLLETGEDTAVLNSAQWAAYSEQLRKACEMLLEKQLKAYRRIRFYWYDLLLLLLGAVFGAYLPETELALCRWNVEQKKMEETLRFETMILVLMHYPEITVENILSWLERFSELFRRALERAVDSFSYNRKLALRHLKEDAGYEPVGRIADALISCDDVRIADAFLNMEAERNYYMDQYRQKVNAWTGGRAALAKVMAFIPFLLVLALKLVVPFVAQGLSQLSVYSDGMATFM